MSVKVQEVLKKAMVGVLFIDEAHYLYRPENEPDLRSRCVFQGGLAVDRLDGNRRTGQAMQQAAE